MRVVSTHNKQLKLALVGCGALLWLGLSGFTLYSLQTAEQQIFDSRLLADGDTFSATETAEFFSQLIGNTQRSTLVFAIDPDCQCSAAAVAHLESIAPTLVASNTQVLLLSPEDQVAATTDLAERLIAKTGLSMTALSVTALSFTESAAGQSSGLANATFMVPSTPAAAVLDAQHQLVYFGPWSSGGACVSGIGGFVESALKALHEPAFDPVFNRAAVGCYCPWPGGKFMAAKPDGRPGSVQTNVLGRSDHYPSRKLART